MGMSRHMFMDRHMVMGAGIDMGTKIDMEVDMEINMAICGYFVMTCMLALILGTRYPTSPVRTQAPNANSRPGLDPTRSNNKYSFADIKIVAPSSVYVEPPAHQKHQ